MVAFDIEAAKNELHEVAMHANNLAVGLQNVAPPQATAGLSAQYLKEMAVELEKLSQKVLELT